MDMELERNEVGVKNDLFSIIEKESEVIEAENGKMKFLIDVEYLAKVIAEDELFKELEKGDWSLKNEPRHSIEDFQKRYGLV